MQRVVNVLGIIALAMAAALFGGCGGTDLFDELGQRYTALIAIQDLDTETLSVDVIQSYCDDDVEDYGPATAAVTFAVSDDANGVTLKSYTLEYLPLPSEDGTGTIVTPPTLDGPLTGGNLSIDIATGGSASFEITCMSTDTKEEFRIKNGWLYYYEVAAGQAELDDIDDEITAKEAQIADVESDKQDVITAMLGTTDPDEIAGYEAQLDVLDAALEIYNADLATLQTQYSTLYRSLYTVSELDEARYKIRITFEFEDIVGETQTVVKEATVWLGPYDNC